MTTRGLPLRAAGPFVGTVTNFVQGALGAGGYASGLAMAPDGSSMFLRNDTGLPWKWTRSTNKWKNVGKQPGMNTITSLTPWEHAYAPSNSSIVYLVYPTNVIVQGSGNGRNVERNYLWRSTDGGETWTQRGTDAISGGNPNSPSNVIKYGGPRMAVDPNNSDVVYIISASGACYVTYNGGTTLTNIPSLLGALPTATIDTANTGGQHSFTVLSNPIDGLSALGYFCYDATWPLAVGTNDVDDLITSSSGTTLGIQQLQNRAGGTDNANSIASGDTIYFGRGGSVAIDGSSGTIANPGGSGVISKVVYFSWQLGSSNVWWTNDGGVNWAALTGTSLGVTITGTGPGRVTGKMRMSFDASLGKASNVLYICDAQTASTFYRFVRSVPTSSGLSANTWTALTIPDAGAPECIAPSPFTAGKVGCLNFNSAGFLSTDYGTTMNGTQTGGPPVITFVSGLPGAAPNGTDVPWLLEVTDAEGSDCVYDPVVDNRLWCTTGVGVYYQQLSTVQTPSITAITKDATGAVVTATGNDWQVGESFVVSGATGMTNPNGVTFYIQAVPPTGGLTSGQLKTNVDSSAYTGTYNSGSGTATKRWQMTSQSADMNSLTTQKIVKVPGAGGKILITCLDRQVFALDNPTTYPSSYWPNIGNAPVNSMDIAYSKSDPTVVWISLNGSIARSTDGGVSGSDVLTSGQAMIASTTPSSCVQIPIFNGLISYTADAGVHWTSSQFGAPVSGTLAGRSPGALQGCSFWMVCDDHGNYYYWDRTTAVFWMSVDGGANFTAQTTNTAFNPVSAGQIGDGGTILCGPTAGDLWFAPGNYLSFNFVVIAYRSTDFGVTWSPCNQAGDLVNVNQMAFGKAKPGGSGYPVLFATGNPGPSFNVNNYGMFRCDDPSSASRVWTPINNFYNVNVEGSRFICGDLDTYGTVYKALDSTGYLVGSLG